MAYQFNGIGAEWLTKRSSLLGISYKVVDRSDYVVFPRAPWGRCYGIFQTTNVVFSFLPQLTIPTTITDQDEEKGTSTISSVGH